MRKIRNMMLATTLLSIVAGINMYGIHKMILFIYSRNTVLLYPALFSIILLLIIIVAMIIALIQEMFKIIK